MRNAVEPLKRRVQAFAELPTALATLEEVLTTKANAIALVMHANSAVKTVTAADFVQDLNDSLIINGTEEVEKKFGFPIYTLEEVETIRNITSETQVNKFPKKLWYYKQEVRLWRLRDLFSEVIIYSELIYLKENMS